MSSTSNYISGAHKLAFKNACNGMRVRCNTSYRTVHEHNKALTHQHKCMSLDTCLIVFDFVGAKFEAKIVYACITTIAITRGVLAGPIVCMF